MRRKLPLLLALASLIFTGAGCTQLLTPTASAPPAVTLQYWRTEDSPAALADVITAYQKLHPNVTINVTQMGDTDYERNLLEAFAEGRGPDLFSLPVTSLRAWQNKLAPLPAQTVLPAQQVDKNKKVVWATVKTPAISIREMKDNFVEGVTQDVIWPYAEKTGTPATDRIWAMTYSMDNLALFYNSELFRKANIPKPPTSWGDFQQAAAKMTVLDKDGNIVESGAAIGEGPNIKYATELLSLIMGQNGTDLDATPPTLNAYSAKSVGHPEPPTVEALGFYQSFVNPGSTAYVWNASMPNSLDAFIQGRTAMFFGLPHDRDLIRARSPKLDFGIAPVPQINYNDQFNSAVFPVEVVARSTKHLNEAWDFLQFAARAENVTKFLEATKRPAALRSLLDAQITDPDLGAFSSQVLTARSWYRGQDYSKVQQAFLQMIAWRPTPQDMEAVRIVSDVARTVSASYVAPNYNNN